MNLNMTFNGNTISPSKYSCPIGYCSAGVQVLPPSYYVDGINTVVTNQTHPGDATGPAITLNIRNDFYLQCNP